MAARKRGAERAVDLDLDQVVALHPRRPRRGDQRERAAFELEGREHLVLDVDVVRLPGFVDAPRICVTLRHDTALIGPIRLVSR